MKRIIRTDFSTLSVQLSSMENFSHSGVRVQSLPRPKSQLPIAWPEPEVADEMWESIAVELEANIQPRSVEHFRLIEVSRFIFHIMRPFWLGVVVGLRRRPIKTGSLRAPDEHSPTRLV